MSRRAKSGSKRAQSMYMSSRMRSSTVGHKPFDDNINHLANSNQNFTDLVSPREQKRNWLSRLSPAVNKRDKLEELPPEKDDGVIYLKEVALASLSSLGKKKRPQYKPTEITLSASRISFTGQKKNFLPLDAILTFELEVLECLRISGEKRTGEQRVLLLVTQTSNLRVHFQVDQQLYDWILTLDGLLDCFHSRQQLSHNEKSDFLKKLYYDPYVGGTIKVGDEEEWSYIRQYGEMSCMLSEGNHLTGAVVSYDGEFLRPSKSSKLGDANIGSGEWDGLNIFWYNDDSALEETDRAARRKHAAMAYQWVRELQEFMPLREGKPVPDDPFNTWRWARVFLARKKQSSHDWIQREGEVPLPLSMFLAMHKWASNTIPPPEQILSSSEEDE